MTNNRCTAVANAPSNSTLSMVSTETRHVVCLGTETEIGNTRGDAVGTNSCDTWEPSSGTCRTDKNVHSSA